MSNAQPNIGFIGLGTMGSSMAANLLAAGYAVVVYNRTRSRADALAAKRARVAASPQEAAANADIVITMLSDDPAVEEVLLGDGGTIAAAKPGTLFIDSSTVTPALSRRCARFAKEKGMRFLDAPVTGSRNEAAAGKLVFVVGGEKHDFDEARPLFDVMGQTRFYCGPSGSGSTLKLANNAVSATFVAAMAESAAVVKASNIDQQVAFDFLTENSAFASRLSRAKLPKMVSGDFSANFALKLMAKDVRYFLSLAKEFGQQTPAIELAGRELAEAAEAGFGDDDVAAIHAYRMGRTPQKV